MDFIKSRIKKPGGPNKGIPFDHNGPTPSISREEVAKTWGVEKGDLRGLTFPSSNPVEVGRVLLRAGLISEQTYLKKISELLKVEYLDIPNTLPELIPLGEIPFPLTFMKKEKLLLFEWNGSPAAAVADPTNTYLIETLARHFPKGLKVFFSTEERITEALNKLYNEGKGGVNDLLGSLEPETMEYGSGEDLEQLKDMASEAPIIRLVNLILSRAIEQGASDVHIEPYDKRVVVRYRIDGVLREVETLPKGILPAVVSRIKIMSKLNIAERRIPQDGRIRINIAGKKIDLRIATLPTLFGEGVVMRILDQSSVNLDLNTLGFPPGILPTFEKLIRSSHGMILVTGPTGSGKTTTLSAALQKINSPQTKIITIEDPIEYVLPGVNQIQVNPQAGLTFASGLRSIVRQDPDVILVGEIRDFETAEIAIQAALTGHLVFSTLHTNDAPSAFTRLLDMGVKDYLVASSVIGILAQRLVRTICPNCKEPYTPPVALLKAMGLESGEEISFWRGKGCEKCGYTGYKGRTGIYELLVVSDEIRNLVSEGVDSEKIKKTAISEGMVTLIENGIEKAKKGITTPEEVFRVAFKGG